MLPGERPDKLEEVLPHPLGPARPPPELVRKASEEGLVKARKMRTDTTAAEGNVHHPTDAGLIYDGVRTLTRLLRKVKAIGTGVDFRDRRRSVKKRLLRITKVLRRRITEEIGADRSRGNKSYR